MPSAEEWYHSVKSLRDKVRSAIMQKHASIRDRYLQKVKSIEYKPGDKVWVHTRNPRFKTDKLDTYYVGPCEVTDRVADTGRYRVCLPTGVEDFHIDSLKPFVSTPETEAYPFYYFSPKSLLPHTDYWVVESILDFRHHNGRQEWKVRWKGHESTADSWEPASTFIGCPEWKKWNESNEMPFMP